MDGVTESLTTDLSLFSNLFVIARNSAFSYKGKEIDVRQVGRELNVRYALEGSVQHNGNRLRVNVQLIDAENGKHLWAERFEKPVVDLFDMQDEIVSRLAYTVAYPTRCSRGATSGAFIASRCKGSDSFKVLPAYTRGGPLSTWGKRANFSNVPWPSIIAASERCSAWQTSI